VGADWAAARLGRARQGQGLRGRLAWFTALAVGGACAAQGLALFALHPDLSGPDLLRAAAVTVLIMAFGGLATWGSVRSLTRPLEALAASAAVVASGDLTRQVDRDAPGEVGLVADAFAAMLDALHRTLVDLREAAATLEREAAEIHGGVTRQATTAAQQAAAIAQTSTTAAEIAQTARQATLHADSVIQMTARSEELSDQGLRVVEEAVRASGALGDQVKRIAATMTDLGERTLQVGEIITSVKDLAEQSNLLALNASIEASKAGEHGRGFAVVAMEMRHLAEQSRQAAVQVRAILSEIQRGAQEAARATDEGTKRATAAVGLARSAGEAIEGLALVIRDSSLAARQIANNTRQQTIGVEQIVAAISELSTTLNESAGGSRAIEQGAANLAEVARRLGEAVRRYRV
jgi:methyl-accepting chemotaxis protein